MSSSLFVCFMVLGSVVSYGYASGNCFFSWLTYLFCVFSIRLPSVLMFKSFSYHLFILVTQAQYGSILLLEHSAAVLPRIYERTSVSFSDELFVLSCSDNATMQSKKQWSQTIRGYEMSVVS